MRLVSSRSGNSKAWPIGRELMTESGQYQRCRGAATTRATLLQPYCQNRGASQQAGLGAHEMDGKASLAAVLPRDSVCWPSPSSGLFSRGLRLSVRL